MGRKPRAPKNPSAIPACNFRGVRSRPCGRFVAEIQDKKTKVRLGIFDSPIAAARAYDRAAVALRGPKTKTNAVAIEAIATAGDIIFMTPRPSMSRGSTVESSSGPSGHRRRLVKSTVVRQRNPNPPRVWGDEARSDCGSSSSVVEDVDGGVESKRRVLPFDLNLPPPMEGEEAWGSDFWL